MYRRYTAHLQNAKGGSVLVNRAVKKYGLENFAFVVIEITSEVKNVRRGGNFKNRTKIH